MNHETEYEALAESDKNDDDARQDIMDEISEYQENAQRSEEDGWFYSDEDASDT